MPLRGVVTTRAEKRLWPGSSRIRRDLVQEQVLDPTAQNAAAEQEIAQRCLVEVDHREADGALVAEAVGVVARHDSHLRIGYPRRAHRQGLLVPR